MNSVVLADEEGIFGSSMSDSTRAMVTDSATDMLVVIYCFENDIDLDALLCDSEDAFERFAGAENQGSQTAIIGSKGALFYASISIVMPDGGHCFFHGLLTFKCQSHY